MILSSKREGNKFDGQDRKWTLFNGKRKKVMKIKNILNETSLCFCEELDTLQSVTKVGWGSNWKVQSKEENSLS